MSLFKKKEKTVVEIAPVIAEKRPEEMLLSAEKRIRSLLKAEKRVEEKISLFEGDSADLGEHTADSLRGIRQELAVLSKECETLQHHFNVLLKGLSLTAKKEDMEKAKKYIDQYDFADMVTREEFKKMS